MLCQRLKEMSQYFLIGKTTILLFPKVAIPNLLKENYMSSSKREDYTIYHMQGREEMKYKNY